MRNWEWMKTWVLNQTSSCQSMQKLDFFGTVMCKGKKQTEKHEMGTMENLEYMRKEFEFFVSELYSLAPLHMHKNSPIAENKASFS